MMVHRTPLAVLVVWLGLSSVAVCSKVRLECVKGCAPENNNNGADITGYLRGNVSLRVVMDDSLCVLDIKYNNQLIVHTYEPNLCRLDIRPVPSHDSRLVFDNYLRRVKSTFVYEFSLNNLQLNDTGSKFEFTTDLKDDDGNLVKGSEVVKVLATTPKPEPTTTTTTTTLPPPVPPTTEAPSTTTGTKDATTIAAAVTTREVPAEVVQQTTDSPDTDGSAPTSSPDVTSAPSPDRKSTPGKEDAPLTDAPQPPATSGVGPITVSPTSDPNGEDKEVVQVDTEMQQSDKESTGTITAIIIVCIGLVAIIVVILIVRRNKRERLRKYDGVGDAEEKLQPIHESSKESRAFYQPRTPVNFVEVVDNPNF